MVAEKYGGCAIASGSEVVREPCGQSTGGLIIVTSDTTFVQRIGILHSRAVSFQAQPLCEPITFASRSLALALSVRTTTSGLGSSADEALLSKQTLHLGLVLDMAQRCVPSFSIPSSNH